MAEGNRLKVVLIRHGETEGNVKGIVQGQWDTPLTEKGISATLKKAEKIRNISFDAVYCSDLSRTVKTLALIRKTIPELPEAVYTKELREIDFGDLTGQAKRDLMPTILMHKAAPELPYPNGESGGQFTARVKAFFLMLYERFKGGRVLAVTHYGVMETAAREFSGPPGYEQEKIVIGDEDVWIMSLCKDGITTKTVL